MKSIIVCENCGKKYKSNTKKVEANYCPTCGYDNVKNIFRISDFINKKFLEKKIPEDTKAIIAHQYL